MVSCKTCAPRQGFRFASGCTLPNPVTPNVLGRPSPFSRRKAPKMFNSNPQPAHPLSIADNRRTHRHHRSSKHNCATAAQAHDRSPPYVGDHHNFLLLGLTYPLYSPSPRWFEHYYTQSSPYPPPLHRVSDGATSSSHPRSCSTRASSRAGTRKRASSSFGDWACRSRRRRGSAVAAAG